MWFLLEKLRQPDVVQLLVHLLFVGICLYVAWTDLRERRIPNDALLFGFLFTTLLALLFPEAFSWSMHALPAIAFTLGFVLLSLWWPAALGMGDAKLLGLLVYGLGFQAFLSVFTLACTFAFLTALLLLSCKKIKAGGTLPYAPFVAVGMLCELIFHLLDFN